MNDPITKLLRDATVAALKEETDLCRLLGLTDKKLEERHLLYTEIEWAWRIRRAFPAGSTFMSAQGAGADRDIVSHDLDVEVEVKYFGSKKPQGGRIPLADWEWLAGFKHPKTTGYRKLGVKYRRATIAFFPRATTGCKVQKTTSQNSPGSRMFTDCLSFTPNGLVPLCFRQLAEIVVPNSKNTGLPLEPRLQFIKPISNPAILQCAGFIGYSEVLGDIFNDPFWAVLQVELPQTAMLQGYHLLT